MESPLIWIVEFTAKTFENDDLYTAFQKAGSVERKCVLMAVQVSKQTKTTTITYF